MNIQTTLRPMASQPRIQSPERSETAEQPQPPKESWSQRSADYLERSNDTLTPKLAAFGGALALAEKGIQISEGMHPVAQALWIVGGGLVGGAMGYAGGNTLQSVNGAATDAVFGRDTSLTKSLVSTGLNSAVFGLVGGWTAGVLHGVATVGGAGLLARNELVGQG